MPDTGTPETHGRRLGRQALLLGVAACICGLVVGIAYGGQRVFGHGASASSTPAGAVMSPAEWREELVGPGAQVRERALEVFESFAGTVAQRDALGVVNAYAANGGMDACMEDAGYPEWDWSLARVYAAPDDPLKANFWLAEPMRPWRSEQLLASKPFRLAEAVMNGGPADPERAEAIDRCLAAGTPPPESALDAVEGPAITRLTNQWWAMLTESASALPDASHYLNCMDAADIPALDDLDIPASELAEGMSAISPDPADIPAGLDDSEAWNAEPWQRLLREEHTLIAADWACRQEVYERHIGDLAPLIDDFAARHADEIREARQNWQRIVDGARDLGYPGQSGALQS